MNAHNFPAAINLVEIIANLNTEQEKPRQGDDACELLDEIILQARDLAQEELPVSYETYTCTHRCLRCHRNVEWEFRSHSPECPHPVMDDGLICPSCYMDSYGCVPDCPNRTDIDAKCLEGCK